MAKDESKLEPWEQLPEESEKAFEAFRAYRDMGEERSVQNVVKKLSKSRTLITRWKMAYNWDDRCRAYDLEQDKFLVQEQRKEIRKMRQRHAELAYLALDKVKQALESRDPEELTDAALARLMEVSSKMERLARGDVGDVIEERDGGEAVNPVQIYIPSNGRERDKQNYDDLEV